MKLLERIDGWATRHEGAAVACMLVVVALYHLVAATVGIDLTDEGFYMTYYDNIWTHPEAVEYNSMYYLTGVLGGAALRLWPGMGLMGMRVLGIAVIVLSALLTWRLLRGRVRQSALLCGLAIVLLAYINRPYALGNAMLTALGYVMAMRCLLRGIGRRQWPWVVVAGAVCGLNVLTRIPNLLAAVLAAVPLLAEWWLPRHERSWRRGLGGATAFAAGMAGALLVMFAAMRRMGHWQPFVDNMGDLIDIAGDTSVSHSGGTLVGVLLGYAGLMALWGALLAVAAWSRRLPRHGIAVSMAAVAIVAAVAPPFVVLSVVAVTGCVWLVARGDPSTRLLAVMALAMQWLMIAGSDTAYNHGTLILLVSLPLSLAVMGRHRAVWVALAVVTLSCAARMAYRGSFSHDGAQWIKTHHVAGERLRGIGTNDVRARLLNNLLDDLAPHVHEGDTLCVIANAPLLNYLTGTVPAGGCSWPGLLAVDKMMARLEAEPAPPAILVCNFRDAAPDGWHWRDYRGLETPHPARGVLLDERMTALNAYLLRHRYRRVTHSPYFSLYMARE